MSSEKIIARRTKSLADSGQGGDNLPVRFRQVEKGFDDGCVMRLPDVISFSRQRDAMELETSDGRIPDGKSSPQVLETYPLRDGRGALGGPDPQQARVAEPFQTGDGCGTGRAE